MSVCLISCCWLLHCSLAFSREAAEMATVWWIWAASNLKGCSAALILGPKGPSFVPTVDLPHWLRVPFSHLLLPQLLSTEKCLAAHLPLFQKFQREGKKRREALCLPPFLARKWKGCILREKPGMWVFVTWLALLSVEGHNPARDRTIHVSERVKQ